MHTIIYIHNKPKHTHVPPGWVPANKSRYADITPQFKQIPYINILQPQVHTVTKQRPEAKFVQVRRGEMPQTIGPNGPRCPHHQEFIPYGNPGNLAQAIIPFQRDDPMKVLRSAAISVVAPFSAGLHQPKTTPCRDVTSPPLSLLGVKDTHTYTIIHLIPKYSDSFP